MLAIYFWAWDLPGVSPGRLPWRTLILQVAIIGDSFWVRDGGVYLLLLSALGLRLVQIHVGPVHAALLSEFMSALCAWFPWWTPSPLALTLFCLFSRVP